MKNQDVIRLAEIRLYFLDPPTSFKIHSYAMPQVEEVIEILKKYPTMPSTTIEKAAALQDLLVESKHDVPATRDNMRQFARLLNEVNR